MNKLWDKGIEVNQNIENFTTGKDPELDLSLIPYDCKASIAHARMLGSKGYLSELEVRQLISGLKRIIELHEKNEFHIGVSQEDCHTAIENFLTDELGEVGKKIHTARSRNDQVLTALRLYYKDELKNIEMQAEQWISALDLFSEREGHISFPGYTHMQKAMPSSFKLWSGAYKDGMKDDLTLLKAVKHLVDQSPLGSAAGFGIPLEINKTQTAEELGFTRIQENPVYCQLSRGKFEITIVSSLSQIVFWINRIASDLILFSMEEFGYVTLPTSFCTGSSIMPQKKNPDVLELLRGSYHIMLGYETQVKTLVSNLISGYNRDIQLSKEPIMRAFDLTKDCLRISTAVITGIKVNKNNCAASMTEDLFATKKVYDLVEKGIPFRDAYRQVQKSLRFK